MSNYKDEFKALIQRIKANDEATPSKKKLNEAASMSLTGDSAADVAELMQIFRNAGLPDAGPVPLASPTDDKVAFGSVDGPEDGDEGPEVPIGSSPDAKPSMAAMASDMEKDHEPAEEEYANEPDEEYQDNDYMQHDLAGGINKPKKMFAKAQDGDNAMAVEELSSIKEKLYAALAEKLVGEISNKRLKSYAKAASGTSHEKSAPNLASKAGYEHGQDDDPGSRAGEKDDEKATKRSKYVGKAIDRISKEDEMRTNEISKKRAGDYINSASSDKSYRSHEIGKINHKASTTGTDSDDREERDYHNKKHGNRSGGIGKAVNKLSGRAKVNATESGKKMFSGYSKGDNKKGKDGHPDKGKLVGESKEVDDILKLNNMLNENKPVTKKSSSHAMDLKKLAGI